MTKFLISRIVLLSSIAAVYGSQKLDLLSLPPNFLIGSAVSSYQSEGAWNIDGKGENSWDYYVHNFPNQIANKSTGDIAADFYHKYPEDIKLMKDIGLNHFRFSISWARIFPNGYSNNVSKSGVQHYHRVLDELEKHRIIPFVTLYHFDHPQALEKIGGWLNEEMAFIFADYAKFIFQEFGNRIKFFNTVNEPNIFCPKAYGINHKFAPGVNLTGIGEYLCVQNMLKAHALSYHIYDKHFRKEQKGKVGLITVCRYYYSKNKNDTEAANIGYDFDCGWEMHPVYSKTGDYPESMKSRIKARSIAQGFSRSRLPVLTKTWIDLIRGSYDFLGLNYYFSFLVETLPYSSILNWPDDTGLVRSVNSSWATTDFFRIVPEGIGDLLRRIKKEYNNPPVYILENGVVDNNKFHDDLRISYLHDHLKEVLTAVNRDGCDVRAYTVWSFIDCFEWEFAYTRKFGLIHVDYNDTTLKRTPKKSALWLKSVIKSRKLQPPY